MHPWPWDVFQPTYSVERADMLVSLLEYIGAPASLRVQALCHAHRFDEARALTSIGLSAEISAAIAQLI
jgi:hypothetical protein